MSNLIENDNYTSFWLKSKRWNKLTLQDGVERTVNKRYAMLGLQQDTWVFEIMRTAMKVKYLNYLAENESAWMH